MWWHPGRTMYILSIVDPEENEYLIYHGKKISNNFFVNIWYLFKRGTCREFKAVLFRSYMIEEGYTRYLFKKRVAKNFLLQFCSDSLVLYVKKE